MSHKMIAAMLAGLAAAAGAPPASAQSAGAGEIAQLRAQLELLQQKIEQLEKAQAETTETQERSLDALAKTRANVGKWVGRFTWKGDVRYRNEQFDVEGQPHDRIRDRIRVRGGFAAKINDTWSTELQLATGGVDPRSSNQTLGDGSSRKDFELDLAYVQWKPNPTWQVTLGKQKQPWVRPGQSFFFDGDLNPEGVAASFAAAGGFFGNAFHYWLQERSAAADSSLLGGQVGWRSASTASVRFTVGVGYYDYGAVQGYDVRVPVSLGGNLPVSGTSASGTSFSAFGNTVGTRAQGAPCRTPISATGSCFVYDYDVAQVFGEVALAAGGYPLTLFADYGRNGAADDEDSAYSLGLTLGRVSNPRSWELGYVYQEIEKDALFGGFVDSDFGDGNTDSKGSAFRFGYGIGRNVNFNATYFLNELNVSGLSGGLQEREYKRLQLDLNFRF